MKKKVFNTIKYLAIMPIIVSFYGCLSNPKKPERNKMPELTGFREYQDGGYYADEKGLNGTSGLSFAATAMDLETVDGLKHFINVPLPDASADSVLISMLTTLKPLAIPLLNNWSHEYNSGLLIDLSGHRGLTVYETSYDLRQPGGISIPVLIRWDKASAYRAAKAQGLVRGMPFISLNKVSGQDPTMIEGR